MSKLSKIQSSRLTLRSVTVRALVAPQHSAAPLVTMHCSEAGHSTCLAGCTTTVVG